MKTTKRIATVGVGLIGKWSLSWIFDFILYPFVISTNGIVLGGIVMTLLSFLFCYALILFYDGTKKDWLGIETLKQIEDFKPRQIPSNRVKKIFILVLNNIGQLSSWIMKKSDALLLIALSIKFDPFITVVHIRQGSHQYNGLSKRDWKVFITSLIIGNVYWTLAIYMGVTLLALIFKFILLHI